MNASPAPVVSATTTLGAARCTGGPSCRHVAAVAARGDDDRSAAAPFAQQLRELRGRALSPREHGRFVLVGDQHVGQRQQFLCQLRRRCGVEQRARARGTRQAEAGEGTALRRLELADHERRPADRTATALAQGGLERQAQPDRARDRGNPARRQQHEAHVGRPRLLHDEGRVHAVAGEDPAPAVAALVVSEQRDEADGRPQLGRRHRLVRGLAAVFGLREAAARGRSRRAGPPRPPRARGPPRGIRRRRSARRDPNRSCSSPAHASRQNDPTGGGQAARSHPPRPWRSGWSRASVAG